MPGAKLAGIAGAAAAQVVVAAVVVLPLYLLELHRVGISRVALAKGVAFPMACGAGVAVVSLAAHQLISLDLIAVTVAGVALLLALAVEARRMRATVRTLRTTVASAGSGPSCYARRSQLCNRVLTRPAVWTAER